MNPSPSETQVDPKGIEKTQAEKYFVARVRLAKEIRGAVEGELSQPQNGLPAPEIIDLIKEFQGRVAHSFRLPLPDPEDPSAYPGYVPPAPPSIKRQPSRLQNTLGMVKKALGIISEDTDSECKKNDRSKKGDSSGHNADDEYRPNDTVISGTNPVKLPAWIKVISGDMARKNHLAALKNLFDLMDSRDEFEEILSAVATEINEEDVESFLRVYLSIEKEVNITTRSPNRKTTLIKKALRSGRSSFLKKENLEKIEKLDQKEGALTLIVEGLLDKIMERTSVIDEGALKGRIEKKKALVKFLTGDLWPSWGSPFIFKAILEKIEDSRLIDEFAREINPKELKERMEIVGRVAPEKLFAMCEYFSDKPEIYDLLAPAAGINEGKQSAFKYVRHWKKKPDESKCTPKEIALAAIETMPNMTNLFENAQDFSGEEWAEEIMLVACEDETCAIQAFRNVRKLASCPCAEKVLTAAMETIISKSPERISEAIDEDFIGLIQLPFAGNVIKLAIQKGGVDAIHPKVLDYLNGLKRVEEIENLETLTKDMAAFYQGKVEEEAERMLEAVDDIDSPVSNISFPWLFYDSLLVMMDRFVGFTCRNEEGKAKISVDDMAKRVKKAEALLKKIPRLLGVLNKPGDKRVEQLKVDLEKKAENVKTFINENNWLKRATTSFSQVFKGKGEN